MAVDQAERMALIKRSMAIAPAYERAVRDYDFECILVLRQELASALDQADKIIRDGIESIKPRPAKRAKRAKQFKTIQ